MKKNILILLICLPFFSANAQSANEKKLSAGDAFLWLSENVFEFEKQDSSRWFLQMNEADDFLQVHNYDITVEVRLWHNHYLGTIIAATVTESDMVMSHQDFYYYSYKNGYYAPITQLSEFKISQFFETDYLIKNNISPDEPMPDYLLKLPESGDTVILSIQNEIFDKEYMGDDPLTKLDVNKIRVEELGFILNGSEFEIVYTKYRLDSTVNLVIKDWNNWCRNENYFTETGIGKWSFTNQISLTGDQFIEVEIQNPYDSIQVNERYITAYGKMVSETEGIIFYDSTIEKRKEKINQWYSSGKFSQSKKAGKNIYRIGTSANQKTPLPKISPKEAEAKLKQQHPDLFNEKHLKDNGEEFAEMRKLKPYNYMLELELIIYQKGKPFKKNIYIRIRHGEC